MHDEYFDMSNRATMGQIIDRCKQAAKDIYPSENIPQRFIVEALLQCGFPLMPNMWESSFKTGDVPAFPQAEVARTIPSAIHYLGANRAHRNKILEGEAGQQHSSGPLGIHLGELCAIAGATGAARQKTWELLFQAGFRPVGFIEKFGYWFPQYVDSPEIRAFCDGLRSKAAEQRAAALRASAAPEQVASK